VSEAVTASVRNGTAGVRNSNWDVSWPPVVWKSLWFSYTDTTRHKVHQCRSDIIFNSSRRLPIGLGHFSFLT